MMTDWPILHDYLCPAGCLFILLTRGDEATTAGNAKAVALWTSVVTLFLTGFMVSQLMATRRNFSLLSASTGWVTELTMLWAWMVFPFCLFCYGRAHADLHSGKLELHHPPCARIYAGLFGA